MSYTGVLRFCLKRGQTFWFLVGENQLYYWKDFLYTNLFSLGENTKLRGEIEGNEKEVVSFGWRLTAERSVAHRTWVLMSRQTVTFLRRLCSNLTSQFELKALDTCQNQYSYKERLKACCWKLKDGIHSTLTNCNEVLSNVDLWFVVILSSILQHDEVKSLLQKYERFRVSLRKVD